MISSEPSLHTPVLRAALCALSLFFLAGCGTVPEVPEVRYYRMPPATEAPGAETEAAAFQQALVVEPLSADGVYNEQAILYSLKPDGNLKPYHYQLWSDPPGRLLQRRLIENLRNARMAPLVTDRLPMAQPSRRITGLIERFERVRLNAGEERWQVYVALQFRLDSNDARPLLSKSYRAEVPAESASIQATVRAFARAIDQCFAEFRADLAALGDA
ncbi:MAG: ABC-type transport auxiliary lipoprotein family protein [Lysobacterales bacterium]